MPAVKWPIDDWFRPTNDNKGWKSQSALLKAAGIRAALGIDRDTCCPTANKTAKSIHSFGNIWNALWRQHLTVQRGKKTQGSLAPHRTSADEQFFMDSTGVTGWQWRRLWVFCFQMSCWQTWQEVGHEWKKVGLAERKMCFRAADHPSFLSNYTHHTYNTRGSSSRGDQIIKVFHKIMSVGEVTVRAAATLRPSGAQEHKHD